MRWILSLLNIYLKYRILIAGGSDVTRKTVTHAYVMAPVNASADKAKNKKAILKYAFYAILVIIGSIIGVVCYVSYNKGYYYRIIITVFSNISYSLLNVLCDLFYILLEYFCQILRIQITLEIYSCYDILIY